MRLIAGLAAASSGADLQGTVRYVDTERGTPGPYGSDPADRFFGVDRTLAQPDHADERRRALDCSRGSGRPAASASAWSSTPPITI